jgi:hypothetical protein
MDALSHWLCGGPSAWLGVAATVTLVAVVAALLVARRKRARGAPTLAAGLLTLLAALATAAATPGESQCVDRAIDEASALEDGEARRVALLVLADPRRPSPLTEEQHQRIARAFEGFPERVRPRSIEVVGDRSIASVRGALRGRRAVLHACVELEPAESDQAIQTWRMAVEADGRVSRTTRDDTSAANGSPPRRDACIERGLSAMPLDPAPAWARVSVELRFGGGQP